VAVFVVEEIPSLQPLIGLFPWFASLYPGNPFRSLSFSLANIIMSFDFDFESLSWV